MSDIEWTDATWNMIAGCSLASPGCARCYAGTMARRQVAMAAAAGRATPYADVVRIAEPGRKARTGAAAWNGVVRFIPERLAEPLRWRKPRRVFVCSMADLFHDEMDFEHIAAVFGVMASAPHHTFQVLTKRATRLTAFLAWMDANPSIHGVRQTATTAAWAEVAYPDDTRIRPFDDGPWPLPNVHLGVSVEDQQRADERLPLLADVRRQGWHTFTSVEPLIGPIAADWSAAEWVIIGGESGPHSRRCDVEWIRRVRDDAKATGAAVFIKQLGAICDGAGLIESRKGNDPDEWHADLRLREFPASMAGGDAVVERVPG